MISVNEYFDGKVKSLGFSASGEKATLGVMVPGDYEFGTGSPETMKIISGSLAVKLPGSETWQDFGPDSSFKVPGNSKFQVKARVDTAYLCLYR